MVKEGGVGGLGVDAELSGVGWKARTAGEQTQSGACLGLTVGPGVGRQASVAVRGYREPGLGKGL